VFRKKHRLRVFKDTVLRTVFGPKKDEVIGDWRRLLNEELYDLFPHQVLFGWSNKE
jgi:hypothetical protein